MKDDLDVKKSEIKIRNHLDVNVQKKKPQVYIT